MSGPGVAGVCASMLMAAGLLRIQTPTLSVVELVWVVGGLLAIALTPRISTGFRFIANLVQALSLAILLLLFGHRVIDFQADVRRFTVTSNLPGWLVWFFLFLAPMPAVAVAWTLPMPFHRGLPALVVSVGFVVHGVLFSTDRADETEQLRRLNAAIDRPRRGSRKRTNRRRPWFRKLGPFW